MQDTRLRVWEATRPSTGSVGTDGSMLILTLYAVTVFFSATLLFAVQPMFARMALPLLGGSANVWNTALVFYQATLLAGYVYADVSTRLLGVRRQAIVHLGVLIAPLPYQAPDQLYRLYTQPSAVDGDDDMLSLVELDNISAHSQSVGAVIVSGLYRSTTYTDGRISEPWRNALVSVDFLNVLGVRPILGRNFVGNAVMNLMQQGPFALMNVPRASFLSRELGYRNSNWIDHVMGSGFAHQADLRTPVKWALNPLNHAISKVVDLVPRRAAFLYEAQKLGYKSVETCEVSFEDAIAEFRAQGNPRGPGKAGGAASAASLNCQDVLCFRPSPAAPTTNGGYSASSPSASSSSAARTTASSHPTDLPESARPPVPASTR